MDKEKLEERLLKILKKESYQKLKPYWDSLDKESDRAIGIVAASLLDTALEELIRAFFVKERGVASLFKDDHILQTMFAKINIAYFCGLLPIVHYHDLKLICRIRNRFAHTLATLDFEDKTIVQWIKACELRPKTMDDTSAYKLKYVIIVQQIADALHFLTWVLSRIRPPLLVEFYKLNEWHWGEMTLTKSKIIELTRKKLGMNQEKHNP